MIMTKIGPARRRREARKAAKKAIIWICSGDILYLGAATGGGMRRYAEPLGMMLDDRVIWARRVYKSGLLQMEWMDRSLVRWTKVCRFISPYLRLTFSARGRSA